MATPRAAGGQWHRLVRKMKAEWAALNAPCWLCGFEINYDITDPNDPGHVEADHLFSRKDRPDLMYNPANLRPSHRSCNQAKGSELVSNDLGVLSRCPHSGSGRWIRSADDPAPRSRPKVEQGRRGLYHSGDVG